MTPIPPRFEDVYPDESPTPPYPICTECGMETTSTECWKCHGEGGWHDCGEDSCCCEDPELIDTECDECHGEGYYAECPNVPHESMTT